MSMWDAAVDRAVAALAFGALHHNATAGQTYVARLDPDDPAAGFTLTYAAANGCPPYSLTMVDVDFGSL